MGRLCVHYSFVTCLLHLVAVSRAPPPRVPPPRGGFPPRCRGLCCDARSSASQSWQPLLRMLRLCSCSDLACIVSSLACPLSIPSLCLCRQPSVPVSHSVSVSNCHPSKLIGPYQPSPSTNLSVTVTLALSAAPSLPISLAHLSSPSLWLCQPLRLCQRHWHTCHHP